jgi:hypothetical protein
MTEKKAPAAPMLAGALSFGDAKGVLLQRNNNCTLFMKLSRQNSVA